MKDKVKISFSFLTGILLGALIGLGIIFKKNAEEKVKLKEMSEKHLALFLLMNQWVKDKQNGKPLDLYFKKNNYEKIAIYGMSYAGETLLDELKETGIEVVYAIDKNIDSIYADIDVLKPDDKLPYVDAVVVTPIFFIDEIREMLSKKMNCPIVSLEDILYEV